MSAPLQYLGVGLDEHDYYKDPSGRIIQGETHRTPDYDKAPMLEVKA